MNQYQNKSCLLVTIIGRRDIPFFWKWTNSIGSPKNVPLFAFKMQWKNVPLFVLMFHPCNLNSGTAIANHVL
jgi:hypothetical protein